VSSYAQGTDVSIIRSIGELDKLVTKHGATGFAYGRDDGTNQTRVMFRIADRMVRFDVAKPNIDEFRRTPTGRSRALSEATRLQDAEEKRRWRSLVLVVKALLVGVADGVISLSDAFLPYTVLPTGETVGEWSAPQLDVAYATAQMPQLMPGGGSSNTRPLAISSGTTKDNT
jgi:hypothetical protein